MPVIWSRDRDGVDRLVFEHAADVLNGRRLAATVLLNLREPIFEGASVGIDQVGDLDARNFAEFPDVRPAPTIQACDRQMNRLVGPDDAPRRFGAADRETRPHANPGQRSIHKLATIQL